MFSSNRKHGPYQVIHPCSYLLPPATNHLFALILIPLLLLSLKQPQNNNNHWVTCQPSNNLEQAGRALAIADGPEFEEPIGNFTVAMGKDVQLPCKISRLANFRSAWLRVEDRGVLTIHTNIITPNYRIGLRVEDEGRNFILTIKNVQPSDRGAYMCQINTVPMKSTVGHLNVLTPPVFEDPSSTIHDKSSQSPANQPQAQPLVPDASPSLSLIISQEKANVSLSCRASGNPAPTISWRREDNEPILLNGHSSTGGGVAKVEGSTLSLSQVSRLSSGAYLCIASNGVLPSPSRRLSLDVQFAPVIRLPQTEVGAQISNEARLVCYVESNPTGSYHWVRVPARVSSGGANEDAYDDDKSLLESSELVNSDKFELHTKQINSEKVQMILVVRKVERNDFGWYRCIAENSLGSQSGSIRLHESSSSASSSVSTFSSSMFGGPTGGRVELFGGEKLSPRTATNKLKSRFDSANALQDRSSGSSLLQSAPIKCIFPLVLLLSCWTRSLLQVRLLN